MTPSPGIEPGPHWWEASAQPLRHPCSPGGEQGCSTIDNPFYFKILDIV